MSTALTAYDIALIAGGFGIAGTLIGVLCTYHFANRLANTNAANAARQAEINNASATNAERLREQMESLSTNMESLNAVYGKMLSAMSNK